MSDTSEIEQIVESVLRKHEQLEDIDYRIRIIALSSAIGFISFGAMMISVQKTTDYFNKDLSRLNRHIGDLHNEITALQAKLDTDVEKEKEDGSSVTSGT
jgi:cell division protein FtsL